MLLPNVRTVEEDEENHPVDPHAMIALDLFAGAGGTTQGLLDAGFRVLAAVEQEEDAATTFSKNHPGTVVLAEDIVDICPKSLRMDLGLESEDLTLLTACPPCQSFSTLGSRTPDDERNGLVTEVWRFTRELNPAAVLIENVPGFARDEQWPVLKNQLRAAGYRLGSWRVDAKDFGVPQRRRRFIVMAIHRELVEFPDDICDLLPPSFDLEAAHAADIISQAGPIEGSGDELHRARIPTPVVLERIRSIPVGGSRYDLPEPLQLPCHKRLNRRGKRGAASPYGRIPPKGPAPTMTTRCTSVSCGRFIHPTEDRGISLREAALLQTFPRGYTFVGSYGSIERQIGNAVPVRLAHALGLAVRTLLDAEPRQHSRQDRLSGDTGQNRE